MGVKIGVVIPTYNMGWCIVRAVKSCISQSYPIQEIILVDDCSTDNTEYVVKSLVKKDNRIHYYKLDKNSGAAQAMMYGVRNAKSDWVAFLDADDELTTNSLYSRVEAIKNYSDPDKLGFVYGNVYVAEGINKKLITNKLISGYQYPYLTKELSLCQQIVMMVNKQKLINTGYPTVFLPSSTDDDMIMSLAKKYEIAYTPEPVAIIHLHSSQTRMTNNLDRVADGTQGLINKYKDDIVRYHGKIRLVLWYIRLFRRKLEARIIRENRILILLPLKISYTFLQYLVKKTFDIHWL